jgi:hypothetical protein
MPAAVEVWKGSLPWGKSVRARGEGQSLGVCLERAALEKGIPDAWAWGSSLWGCGEHSRVSLGLPTVSVNCTALEERVSSDKVATPSLFGSFRL